MRQKIDIAEVESATKIRAKYLRALENEEFGLLPGNTFVKTFMRTYAEYLGLDAQLLIEEYRVDYEPRAEADIQPYVSPSARRRREERRRPRPGRRAPTPPGPGTALLVVVGVVLVIFVILGVTAGSDNSNTGTTPTTAQKPPRKPKHRKPATKPQPTSVRLRIVPTTPTGTYLCVDHGPGTPVVYQNTATSPQVFRGKRLRVNIGNTGTVTVSANGKRVPLAASSTPVGLDLRPGRTKQIPASQRRPCT